MREVIFFVEEDSEGGYVAVALKSSIFTQADTLCELKAMVLDAVNCHFEEMDYPETVRLRFSSVRD